LLYLVRYHTAIPFK